MPSASRQLNPQDPRWSEVRVLLPVVELWLATVADLLRSGRESEQAGLSRVADEAWSLARVVKNCASNSMEGLDVAGPLLHNVARIPIGALPTDIDERLRLRWLFEQYEACREELTRGQWAAVCLRYRDGLSQADIAQRLGKSRSAVHGLLKRARPRKEDYHRRVRAEQYELARKNLNS